jgi:sugar phosphate isomerase/epimerase
VSIYLAQWLGWDELLPLAATHGFGLEIQEFCNPAKLGSCDEYIGVIEAKIAGTPLRSCHGPFSDLVPASRDSEIRAVVRRRFDAAYRIALALRAGHLILHTGFIPKTYPRQEWLDRSVAFWTAFLAEAPGSVRIHLENVYEDDWRLLADLLDAIGDERLTACLDVGHVNANSSRRLPEWIRGLNGRIGYVHLHNNDSIHDDHFGLDRGTIDMRSILEALQEHAPAADWSIETAALRESIEWLERNGFLTPA